MTKYVKFKIYTKEPVKIANIAASKDGEIAVTRYIPGATIRGAVIANILKKNENLFNDKRVELLSENVRFYNGYPLIEGCDTFPSIKGFYEDKGETKFENVIRTGDFKEGLKRAKLGNFCRMDKNVLKYTNVELGERLNIAVNGNSNKTEVFRNELISKGQTFGTYIACDNSEAAELLKDILETGDFSIGSNRSVGYGSVAIREVEIEDKNPNENMVSDRKDGFDDYVYMIMLSNTAMVNNMGENAGLDMEELEQQMGVKNCYIQYCATSVVSVSGVNRTWGIRTPQVSMYEAGSAFRLIFEGHLNYENIKKIEAAGIGMKVNEGCGRILFTKDIEFIAKKEAAKAEINLPMSENSSITEEDNKVLAVIARGMIKQLVEKKMEEYIVEHPMKVRNQGASKSQIGTIRDMCQTIRYTPSRKKEFAQYFAHVEEKEESQKQHTKQRSQKNLESLVMFIIDEDFYEIIGIDGERKICNQKIRNHISEDEIFTYKMDLIIGMMKLHNRGGKMDD